jgi:nucleotide-binding universal stress UspA family protein
MKLLIAYDGSKCSEAALDDLAKAGLPSEGEAQVITVAEVWLPPSQGIDGSVNDDRIEALLEHAREKGRALVHEAEQNAARAVERLKRILPSWTITGQTTYGSPAWEIINAADSSAADLIIVGSQGQSAISRLILGSISQKVLTEAHCSVRVARGKIETEPSAIRIAIGFDSTKGAQAAVEAVAERSWPEGTQVRLVSVMQDAAPTIIGKFVPAIVTAVDDVNDAEHAVLTELATSALERLKAAGLEAEMHIESGVPKAALVEHAEAWNADSIFVGANAFGSRLERFMIGSTSSAVAARAHCTVEVVRH